MMIAPTLCLFLRFAEDVGAMLTEAVRNAV